MPLAKAQSTSSLLLSLSTTSTSGKLCWCWRGSTLCKWSWPHPQLMSLLWIRLQFSTSPELIWKPFCESWQPYLHLKLQVLGQGPLLPGEKPNLYLETSEKVQKNLNQIFVICKNAVMFGGRHRHLRNRQPTILCTMDTILYYYNNNNNKITTITIKQQ